MFILYPKKRPAQCLKPIYMGKEIENISRHAYAKKCPANVALSSSLKI
jgi:hypothetical protein